MLLSGFRDACGKAQQSAEFAMHGAESVRALRFAACSGDSLVELRRPELTLGDGDAKDLRRAAVRVR